MAERHCGGDTGRLEMKTVHREDLKTVNRRDLKTVNRRDLKTVSRRDLLKGAGAALPMLLAGAAAAQSGTMGDVPQGPATGGVVDAETVYELRVYHLNEGKLPLILERFQSKERAIFARCGMHEVAFWVPVEGDIPANTLVYLMRHKSLAAAKASWKMFSADPEWVKVKAETEKDGAFVKSREDTYLKLADFSPKI
jgi:hypothetical protein